MFRNICYSLDSDSLQLLLGPTLQRFSYFQKKQGLGSRSRSDATPKQTHMVWSMSASTL